MIVIGVTGVIGMGKTTYCHKMRQMGLPVHDADFVVHQLIGPHGKAVLPILALFPECGSLETGIDRPKLGQIVFKSSDLRQKLEAILHPLVIEAETVFLQKQARAHREMVFLDIPLLFETGADSRCDYVIVVSAPAFLQKQRVLARPGMSEEKFLAIKKIQQPDHLKRAGADWVIPSHQGHRHQIRKWQQIKKQIKSQIIAPNKGGFSRGRYRSVWGPSRLLAQKNGLKTRAKRQIKQYFFKESP